MCTKLLVNLRVKDYIDTTGAVNGMEEKFYIFYNVYNIPLEQFMQPLQKLSPQIEATYQNMTLDFTLNLPSKFISTHFISPFTNDLFNNVTTYVLIGCSAFFSSSCIVSRVKTTCRNNKYISICNNRRGISAKE